MKNGLLVALAIAAVGVPLAIGALQDRDHPEPVKELRELPPPGPAAPPAPAAHGPAQAAPAAGTWTSPAMDRAFFDEVFLSAGPHPGLGRALAGLRFDEYSDKQPPEWRTGKRVLFGRAEATLHYGDIDQLIAVLIEFPDDGTTALEMLTTGWGPPERAVGGMGAGGMIDTDPRAFWPDALGHPPAELRMMGDRAVVGIGPGWPPLRIVKQHGH